MTHQSTDGGLEGLPAQVMMVSDVLYETAMLSVAMVGRRQTK